MRKGGRRGGVGYKYTYVDISLSLSLYLTLFLSIAILYVLTIEVGEEAMPEKPWQGSTLDSRMCSELEHRKRIMGSQGSSTTEIPIPFM